MTVSVRSHDYVRTDTRGSNMADFAREALPDGFRSTPEALVALIDYIVNPPDDKGHDPTEEEIDAWLLSMVDKGEA
jgi:hypothetical protein